MKNEQILKQVIEKAVKNGYWYTDNNKQPEEIKCDNVGCWLYDSDGTGSWKHFMQIIFSHDFAKAFWGEEITDVCPFCVGHEFVTEFGKEWQYRLAEMVLEEDPIKYLEKFI